MAKNLNSDLKSLSGTPVCASEGQLTRSDNEASGRPKSVDLGMGKFNPRAGANKQGKYLVDGSGDNDKGY